MQQPFLIETVVSEDIGVIGEIGEIGEIGMTKLCHSLPFFAITPSLKNNRLPTHRLAACTI